MLFFVYFIIAIFGRLLLVPCHICIFAYLTTDHRVPPVLCKDMHIDR